MDDRQHAFLVWNTIVNRQFTVLSDPGAQVIRAYGIVHSGAGQDGKDIALDTTVFIEVDGRERWRHVSQTLPDLPTPQEVLTRIRQTPAAPKGPARAKPSGL